MTEPTGTCINVNDSSLDTNVKPHAFWQSLVLVSLHGAFFLLAFPPYFLWPLILVAIAPLAWMALQASSTKRALMLTFGTQFLMWLWMGRWMISVTIAGYPAYALYLSIYPLIFVWLIRRLPRNPWVAKLPMTFLLPLLWVGLECLKGSVIWNGYPWFLLAHPTIEWSVQAQSADLLGAYFVSFIVALGSGVLVDVWRWRRGLIPKAQVVKLVVFVATVFTLNIVYGVWRTSQDKVLRPGPSIFVIQTNLPQDNKIRWTHEAQVRDFRHFIQMTRERIDSLETLPDLIAWPETMLPGFGLEPEEIAFLEEGGYFPQDFFSRSIVGLRNELKVPFLVGSPVYLNLRVEDQRFAWDENYNSVYLIDGEPPYQRYDKKVLTPFGETMPYISAWPWLEKQLLSLGAQGMTFSLDSSDELRLLDLAWQDQKISMAAPICFEDTVASLCRQMVWREGGKKADLFVNLSNDGWYGGSSEGRIQHAQIARFRCIENRLPMVRIVNTGLSMLIDSSGNVARTIGEGRYGDGRIEGSLLADVQLDSRRTLYGSLGDMWGWICLGLTLSITAMTFSRRLGRR
ncbi:MAG: apolipoprotein N-acyltransferase [Planctomycetota bacterium]|nr:apolipoprotein N-acyltransferase [Planctomycetota bacterium]